MVIDLRKLKYMTKKEKIKFLKEEGYAVFTKLQAIKVRKELGKAFRKAGYKNDFRSFNNPRATGILYVLKMTTKKPWKKRPTKQELKKEAEKILKTALQYYPPKSVELVRIYSHESYYPHEEKGWYIDFRLDVFVYLKELV